MSIQDVEPPPVPPPAPPEPPRTTGPTPPSKPEETVSERYLRQIRNVVVAAFIIWIAGAVIAGIAYVAIAVHDHNVAHQNACSSQGGVYVNGQCID